MSVATLDINDHDDQRIAKGYFDAITAKEWRGHVEYAFSEKLFSYDEKNFLTQMEKKAGLSKYLTIKQVFKALGLVERIEKAHEVHEDGAAAIAALQDNLFHPATKNITFRVAWHDSGWNGKICENPKANRYCSGYHSLLSDRIRDRKLRNIDLEIANSGLHLTDIEYLPPCFWSINLFGAHSVKVKHDNPAARNLSPIGEKLPPNSIFSWPFGISFSRSWQETERDGSYPSNLEAVRIPIFNAKVQRDKSIGFVYANYSNPFTEEEDTYLLIGCGLISDKGELYKFGPKEEIMEIRQKKKKLRNFPETNWALRFTFDDPDTMVRMPYHEYIAYSTQKGFSEVEREDLFDSIKVSITEPELEHCFKFVAMDIDDDEAIYLLCKMRQKLLQAKTAGVVAAEDIQKRIEKAEFLLEFTWNKRGYFPGFSNLCRQILGWDGPDFPLATMLDAIKDVEEDYASILVDIFNDPHSYRPYKKYAKYIEEITEKLGGAYGLSIVQFLQLAMLNLTQYQFERILSGRITDLEKPSHTPLDICENPYLLFEEYLPAEANILESTGETIDDPIELFKIDIAFYPDRRYLDRIPLQKAFKYEDIRRIRALILQFLATLKDKGDCFEDAPRIEEAMLDYPLFYKVSQEYTLVKNFLLKVEGEELAHLEESLAVVTANDTRYFYLRWVYNCEKEVEQAFRTLLDEPANTITFDGLSEYLKKSVDALKDTMEGSFDEELFLEERNRLYRNIFAKRLFILAGNAGSGKSYELLNILSELDRLKETYLLLTPTGKAALRLMNDRQFEGIEASTIDKLIAEVESGVRSKASILRINNIIVDEMSMVDLEKFHRLLTYVNYKAPSFKRLILVGDPNQLPPIGYGKVLRDVIYFCSTNPAYNDNLSELTVNCRMQLAKSKVLELSEAFMYKGEFNADLIKLIGSGKDQLSDGLRLRFWENETILYEQILSEFNLLCKQHKIAGSLEAKLHKLLGLREDGSFDRKKGFNLENFQLITPYKASSYFGAAPLNEFIQETFKPGQLPKIMDKSFKQSDKVIRTKNYYDRKNLLISNGSIGLARDEGEELLYIPENDYEGINFHEIRKSERENFELAYCITIHKSQGSGFDHTFIIIPQKLSLLSRELVYTALTRSRKSATIFMQGSADTPFERSLFEKARRRSFTEFRKTTLLLGAPFRYYSLEPEPGIFVESRIELMIYNALMQTRSELGTDKFNFIYETDPMIDGRGLLPIKTDFTLYINGQVYYWEHLGRINDNNYKRKWREIKYPTYDKFEITDRLITTDEVNGIDPAKIIAVIKDVIDDALIETNPSRVYSKHHYSLR